MASSAKNLDELFHPAKRLRPLSPSEPPDALIPHSPLSPLRKASPARRDPAPESAAAPALTPEQKQRIEINKALARSKRNLRICRERVEKAKGTWNFVRVYSSFWFVPRVVADCMGNASRRDGLCEAGGAFGGGKLVGGSPRGASETVR